MEILNSEFKNNNFDIIRLIAACQVVVVHSLRWLGFSVPTVIDWFPGVPIFFSISGFLITASYLNRKNLFQYYRNRVLRIFPALWVCVLVSVVLLGLFGQFTQVNPLNVVIWLINQLTFFQFLGGGSGVFGGFGVGTVNGSLWTISTELQFYIILPILMAIFFTRRSLLIVLFVGSVALYFWAFHQNLTPRPDLFMRALFVSVLAQLFGFLLGVFSYLYFDKIKRIFAGTFFYWLILYLIFMQTMHSYEVIYQNSIYLVASRILLAGVVFSAAYTSPNLGMLLHGTDISYGVYLYHMLWVNVAIELGMGGGNRFSLMLVLPATISSAYVSWTFIEKRALRLKGRTLLSR